MSHLPPGGTEEPAHSGAMHTQGKAPPMDPLTREDMEVWFDDWLLSLERAKLWNDWSEDELMFQLASHLHGLARQEWSL